MDEFDTIASKLTLLCAGGGKEVDLVFTRVQNIPITVQLEKVKVDWLLIDRDNVDWESCKRVAFIYLDRIHTKGSYRFDQWNIVVLFRIALHVARKVLDDEYFNLNRWVASQSGYTVAEFKLAEYKFLKMIKFELYVRALDA